MSDEQTPQPDIKPILDRLNLPDNVKAQAWDAYYGAKDPGDFKQRFDSLAIPDDAKANLWDMRFSPQSATTGAVPSPSPSLAKIQSNQQFDQITSPSSPFSSPETARASLSLGQPPATPRSTAEGLVTEQAERNQGAPLRIATSRTPNLDRVVYGDERRQAQPVAQPTVPLSDATQALPAPQAEPNVIPVARAGGDIVPGVVPTDDSPESLAAAQEAHLNAAHGANLAAARLSGVEGYPAIARGVENLLESGVVPGPASRGPSASLPNATQRERATSAAADIVEGTGEAATPLFAAGGAEALGGLADLASGASDAEKAAAVAKAAKFAAGVGGGYAASEIMGRVVRAVGGTPEQERLARDVAFFLPIAAGTKGAYSEAEEPTSVFRNLAYKAGQDLPEDFTPEQAKSAFKKAQANIHPDVNPSPEAAELSQDLGAAYQKLNESGFFSKSGTFESQGAAPEQAAIAGSVPPGAIRSSIPEGSAPNELDLQSDGTPAAKLPDGWRTQSYKRFGKDQWAVVNDQGTPVVSGATSEPAAIAMALREQPATSKQDTGGFSDTNLGPGAANVEENPRNPLMMDLTDSINRSSKLAGNNASIRMRTAATLAAADSRASDAIGRSWDRAKAAAAELWDSYKNSSVKYSDFDQANRDRIGARQEAAIYANEFAGALKKSASPLEREAMVNYLEAGEGGNADDILRERAAQSKPHLRPGYELARKLTDAQRTIVNNVRTEMDAQLEEAQKAGIVEHGVQAYIQHIWKHLPDKAKQNYAGLLAEMNLRSLQPNPSFSKRRVWATYFEGEQRGAVPALKDIGFLVANHYVSLAQAISDRKFIRALTNELKTEDGQPVGIVAGGVKIADREKGDAAYFIKPRQTKNPGDYVHVDHPALRKWKWAGKDENGRPAFIQGDILIHKSVAGKLKAILGTSAVRSFKLGPFYPGKALLRLQTEFKGALLGLSPHFHMTTEAQHAMFHRVAPVNLPKLDMENPDQRGLVHNGLMVADYHGLSMWSDGLAATGGLLIHKLPIPLPTLKRNSSGMRKLGVTTVGALAQQQSEWLFTDYIPRLKMKMALAALERNRARYGKKLSDPQILKLTSDQANAAFGELNYEAMARSKTMQDVMRLTLLAPDFLEARARFVGQAAKPYGTEQLHALLLGALGLYVGARILNKLLDGDYHWDKPFSVVIRGHEYSLRTIQGDIAGLVSDPGQFLRRRLNPTTLVTAFEAITGRDERNRKRDALGQFMDFLKRVAPIPSQGFITDKALSTRRQIADSLLRMVGVNSKRYKTAAEDEADRRRMEHFDPAKQEKPQGQIMAKYYRQIAEKEFDQKGALDDLTHGRITPKDYASLAWANRTPPLVRDLRSKDLSFDDALAVWQKMTPEEQKETRPELIQSYQRTLKTLPVAGTARADAQRKLNQALSPKSAPAFVPPFMRRLLNGSNATASR
ncbi:MAG TPA: hypothetical protein VK763_14445 [Terriglobales bacterium]|jgi:hypothetical protein|nr:hypothetical protein [Terriglobales bacterium]